MQSKLRALQKQASSNWAIDHARFEAKLLVLQWLDEHDFCIPEEFSVSIHNYHSTNVTITCLTATERPLYQLSEEIQCKLRVVPEFDPDYPMQFDCPSIYIDDVILRLRFQFDESLLEGLLGDFCKIIKVESSHSYPSTRTEVICFTT